MNHISDEIGIPNDSIRLENALADKLMRAREVAVKIAADKCLETDTRSMKLLTKRVVDVLKRQEKLLGSRMDETARAWWRVKPPRQCQFLPA